MAGRRRGSGVVYSSRLHLENCPCHGIDHDSKPLVGQQTTQQPVIAWTPGPFTADLGGIAEFAVPKGFLITDKRGTQKLLELTQNIPSGAEVGALIPEGRSKEDMWFVTFEFHEVGFVTDDEKDKMDITALLKSVQDGKEASNKLRSERGWPPFHVIGWQHEPYYDSVTNNLTWSILGRDDKGIESVNHSVRILGRHGTMNIDFVMSPELYANVVPGFDSLIGGFKYHEGHRYADYVSGDKLAGYGLTALIAGGAGALAVKTGLLMKMWKLFAAFFAAAWKIVVAVCVAIIAWIKRMFRRLTGREDRGPAEAINVCLDAAQQPQH